MIWDRFDDAHDDLRSDIFENKNKIETLKARLDAAGIAYKPYQAPESGGEPGPQGWYEDTQREEAALAAYEAYLSGLLIRAQDAD
jgi:hypothetical protein